MQDLRICFVGDSYMNGTGDLETLGWVRRLCKLRLTPTQRFTSYELGIRGQTTDGLKDRWQAECAQRLPEGSDNRVVLQFGINDVAEIVDVGVRVPLEQSVHNAREIVTGVAALYPVLWVGLPPANVPCSPMHPSPGLVITFDQDRAIALNDAYRDLAAELKVAYCDIQTPLLADAEYMAGLTKADQMHCDGRGYELMAAVVDQWEPWAAWFRRDGDDGLV